jgi:hypothetical protein
MQPTLFPGLETLESSDPPLANFVYPGGPRASGYGGLSRGEPFAAMLAPTMPRPRYTAFNLVRFDSKLRPNDGAFDLCFGVSQTFLLPVQVEGQRLRMSVASG